MNKSKAENVAISPQRGAMSEGGKSYFVFRDKLVYLSENYSDSYIDLSGNWPMVVGSPPWEGINGIVKVIYDI